MRLPRLAVFLDLLAHSFQLLRVGLEPQRSPAARCASNTFSIPSRLTKPAKPPPMAGRKQEVLQLRE